MSVVHKMIDLDFLARELRKHGKVLSRCEECGRLFTDVQKAMLHRKVHSTVAILLPRTLDDNHEHKSGVGNKKTSAPVAEPQPDPSSGEILHNVGQLDYSFIIQAIANANESMTFGDLEKLSCEISQKNIDPSGSRKTASGTDQYSFKARTYKGFESSGSHCNTRVTGQADHCTPHTTNMSVSGTNMDVDNKRSCSHSETDVSPAIINQKQTITRFSSSDVDFSSGHSSMPSFPACVQNPPDSIVQNDKSLDPFVSNSQSCGLLDVDFTSSSVTVARQSLGSHHQQQPSITHRSSPDQLLQHIMGGSSFLQLLNEPLDESFGDLCSSQFSSSYASHQPHDQHTNMNSQGYSFHVDNTQSNTQGYKSYSDGHAELTAKYHQGFKPPTSGIYSENINTRVPRNNWRNDDNILHNQNNSSANYSTCSRNNSLPSTSNPAAESKVRMRNLTTDTDNLSFSGNESTQAMKISTTKQARIAKQNDAKMQMVDVKDSECHGKNYHGNPSSGLSEGSADKLTISRGSNSSSREVVTCGPENNTDGSGGNNDGSGKTTSGSELLGKDPSGKSIISLSLIPCKHCSLTFETFSDLIQHMSNSHRIIISKCSKCGQIFYDPEEVKKHLLIHKPIVPLGPRISIKKTGKFMHRCQVCWKEFQSVYEYRSHMMSHPHPYVFTPESMSDPAQAVAGSVAAVASLPAAITDRLETNQLDAVAKDSAIHDTSSVDAIVIDDVDNSITVDAIVVDNTADNSVGDGDVDAFDDAAGDSSVKTDESSDTGKSFLSRTRKLKRKRKNLKIKDNKFNKKPATDNDDHDHDDDLTSLSKKTNVSDNSNQCRTSKVKRKGNSKWSMLLDKTVKQKKKRVGESYDEERNVMKLKLRSNRNKNL